MKTNQKSVSDLNVLFNSDKNIATIQFENEIISGNLLRTLFLAINLPYSTMNLPLYTQADAITPLLASIKDRPFLSVRDHQGNLASFVGLGKGWVSDEQFLDLCHKFEQKCGVQKDLQHSVLSGAVELKATYKIEDGLTSIGDKSLFSSYFTITRLAEGGVSGDASLFRLACSNGMTVPTRFSDHVKINSIADADKFISKAQIQSKASLIGAVDQQLFDPSGLPYMASVREFKTVSKLIDRYTHEPNKFLNRETVDKFYAERGFPSHIQNFPSGMTYFDIYNVATHTFSNIIKDTPLVEANIELGNLLFSKRDASSGIQDVAYIPVFDNLETLRGDFMDATIADEVVIDVLAQKKANKAAYARQWRANKKAAAVVA